MSGPSPAATAMVEVFTPSPRATPARPLLGPLALARAAVRGLVAFYRHRSAWLTLAVTSVALCYIGGAAMFWFHAIALGEGGPAISWYAHWLLDSTFAFIALTPALFLIIPFAAWAAGRLAAERSEHRPWLYVGLTGGLFALVTVPGPIAHDLFVARGTWLADTVTGLIGDPNRPLPPTHSYPIASTLTSQFGFAVPTYVLLAAASLVLVRWINGRRQRAMQIEALALALGRHARDNHP